MSANVVTDIKDIGPHYQILIYEKNVNPENIMIVYGMLDSECRIQPVSDGKLFDVYWRKNREDYKPVNFLFKKGISKRTKVEVKSQDSFDIFVFDLKELETDLQNLRVTVQAEKNPDGTCAGFAAYMTLGPSDQNARIRLESIYSETQNTLNPMSPKLIAITFKGINVKTGQVVARRYLGRPD
ncbi:MAG: hypothetical protein ACXWC9_10935 [Pseudobdellovibrionaceae bacterium]